MSKTRTLVLGLGNELLGDDAIGLIVVRELCKILSKSFSDKVSFVETSAFGYRLLDLIENYDRLIVIDSAIVSSSDEIGSIYVIDINDLHSGTTVPHEMSLKDIISIGTKIGLRMPSDIRIVAIGVKDPSFQLSENIKAALPKIVENIKNLLLEWLR